MKQNISIKLNKVLDQIIDFNETGRSTSDLYDIGEKVVLGSSDILIMFDISDTTLNRWRKKKLIRYFKISGKCHYMASDIMAMLPLRIAA